MDLDYNYFCTSGYRISIKTYKYELTQRQLCLIQD